MELEKVSNYKFEKLELENKIMELEKQVYQSEYTKNLIRKYKSELEEVKVLKYLNDIQSIKAIKYVRDYTEKAKTSLEMTIDELIENDINMNGTDLYVQTKKNKLVKIDMKVLEYDLIHRKTDRIMNGKLVDNEWGMENFIFQVEGIYGRNGWANDRYKNTDMLIIYIRATNTIYRFNYKKLVRWINDKINNKEITEKDYIVFGKYWDSYRRRYNTRECIVSIPCNSIPRDIIIDIHKID